MPAAAASSGGSTPSTAGSISPLTLSMTQATKCWRLCSDFSSPAAASSKAALPAASGPRMHAQPRTSRPASVSMLRQPFAGALLVQLFQPQADASSAPSLLAEPHNSQRQGAFESWQSQATPLCARLYAAGLQQLRSINVCPLARPCSTHVPAPPDLCMAHPAQQQAPWTHSSSRVTLTSTPPAGS